MNRTQRLHQAFAEGRSAFYNAIWDYRYGRSNNPYWEGRLDCPYRGESLLGKEWQRGMNTAFQENADPTVLLAA